MLLFALFRGGVAFVCMRVEVPVMMLLFCSFGVNRRKSASCSASALMHSHALLMMVARCSGVSFLSVLG